MADTKKAIIIGAGLGGLSAAIRLAKLGVDVHVYEQNGKPGGKASTVVNEGFRFDTGPSLLTMPFVLKELFDFAGARIEDYIDLIPLEITCKYFYPDGTILNAYSDVSKLAGEIAANTKDTEEQVYRYLAYSETIYGLTADLFLFNSFSDLSSLLNTKGLKTLFNINKIDPFRTMHEANASFFNDSKTIQLFDRYATYNGSNPYEAPATLNIIQHVEYNLGSYIAKSGIYSITEGLYKLASEMGVTFHFNTGVDSILHKNKKVRGITTRNSEIIESDILISNADVNFTYTNLLHDVKSSAAKKYKTIEPSSSALVFYWGIDGKHPELEIHNILFSEDYRKEFIKLFDEKVCPDDPTIYIYISSKFNNSDAPGGKENWFVMINAPYDTGQDWDKEIIRLRKIIIEKINRALEINIEKKILYEETLTPVTIENKTSSSKGSIYGISSNNKMSAFMRQPNKSGTYQGLYFAGGSAHPGGGIPLVLLSGKIAADLITKHELE